MTEYVIGKASEWGSSGYSKNESRLWAKKYLLEECYSITDHKWFYSCRKKGSRGQAKQTEGFLIAYPYHVSPEGEKRLSEICERAELKYLIEPHAFRTSENAFRVIIYDKDVNLEYVLSQAERLMEEREVLLRKPIWDRK